MTTLLAQIENESIAITTTDPQTMTKQVTSIAVDEDGTLIPHLIAHMYHLNTVVETETQTEVPAPPRLMSKSYHRDSIAMAYRLMERELVGED